MADGKVLVTGASGFVGSAVARVLAAAGYRVRAMVRATSRRTNLDGLDVEIVCADMRDPEAVRAAVAGARYVFHVAADYRLWARDQDELLRNNLDGTRNVMEAAIEAGTERVVYTSSVATLRSTRDGVVADEAMRLDEGRAVGAYKRSKIAAEHAVDRMIAEQALPAIVVHPSTPIGRGDVKPTPTGRIVIEAATGRIPGYVDTGLNLVCVDDVAQGHLAALERGKIGAHYILGGENVPLAAFLTEIASLTGHRAPKFALPRPLLYPFAVAAEAMAHITHRDPFLTIDGLRMSATKMFYTSAKAERELGYKARPYRDGLVEALAWFRSHGYLI